MNLTNLSGTVNPPPTGATWSPGRASNDQDARPLDVAVLDVALRQGLMAVQQLGRAGYRVGAIECAETHPVPAYASRHVTALASVPDRELNPDRLVDSVLELVRQRSVRVIVPVHDGTIEAIQTRRAEVDRACAVALAAPKALDAASDKEQTLGAAEALGIRAPRAVHIDCAADTEGALAEIGLPAVVKPTRSWVTAPDGQAHRLSPIAIVNAEECHAAVAALLELGSTVLLQQWIPGARESVSFVHERGQYFGEFAQVAHRMVPILGGNSVGRESIPLPHDAADAARRLVAELELDGYAEVEFRRDASGTPVLMEINPRLSASVGVAVRAGVDFPRLVYQWASGERLQRQVGYRTGVRMRWLGGDLRWLVDSVRFQKRPDVLPVGRAVSDFVRDFARPSGYDYVARDDLRPAAVASASGVRSAIRTVSRRLVRRSRA